MNTTTTRTADELRKQRHEMSDRVDYLKRRRVEIADRIGLAVVDPAAVSPQEMEALREERVQVNAELNDLLDGLVVLGRMYSEAVTVGGPAR